MTLQHDCRDKHFRTMIVTDPVDVKAKGHKD